MKSERLLLQVKYYFLLLLLLLLLPGSYLQMLFMKQIHFFSTVALSDESLKSSFALRIEICTQKGGKGICEGQCFWRKQGHWAQGSAANFETNEGRVSTSESQNSPLLRDPAHSNSSRGATDGHTAKCICSPSGQSNKCPFLEALRPSDFSSKDKTNQRQLIHTGCLHIVFQRLSVFAMSHPFTSPVIISSSFSLPANC